MNEKELKDFLDKKAEQYNQPSFIKDDPISIPHLFSRKQDIEIAAFFAAIFAWGNRTTIIRKSKELLGLMDNAPYDFCLHHKGSDLKKLLEFRHRTFHATDLLYFISFFQDHYSRHQTLEAAFISDAEMKEVLIRFHHYFFSLEHVPARTKKHIATPERNSSCKRLNMFLRWMVRKDDHGVDFGIWENISPAKLICPIDLHVARVAKKLRLLKSKPTGSVGQPDWKAAEELTEKLRRFDMNDPVKYDFALFGLGIIDKFY